MKEWSLILFFLAGIASASPETSLRPQERPAGAPVLSGSGAIERTAPDAAARQAASGGQTEARSPRPVARSGLVEKLALMRERMRKRGAICGDRTIKGEQIGAVPGKKAGCGVTDAVRIWEVGDVALSARAVMDCNTAVALSTWVEESAKPTLANTGGGLKRLRVASHYSCRTRNSMPGARISEHGKGRAIDISGFRLQDGTLITLRNGWNGKETGPLLRKMHADACGVFGTVLGPESDRFHLDHFHFDTARYRSGAFCR